MAQMESQFMNVRQQRTTTRWPCDDSDNENFTLYKSDMGAFWSRHHSWCCVKGRLHAAARRRRVKKYCQCGKGGRQFRRPRWLMLRKRLKVHGCAPCAGSHTCCHETSPGLKPKLLPSKSILNTSQMTSKPNKNGSSSTQHSSSLRSSSYLHRPALSNPNADSSSRRWAEV